MNAFTPVCSTKQLHRVREFCLKPHPNSVLWGESLVHPPQQCCPDFLSPSEKVLKRSVKLLRLRGQEGAAGHIWRSPEVDTESAKGGPTVHAYGPARGRRDPQENLARLWRSCLLCNRMTLSDDLTPCWKPSPTVDVTILRCCRKSAADKRH